MVHRICTIAEISLGLSVSDFFTAPVTHQDQGHSGKFTPIFDRVILGCVAEQPLLYSISTPSVIKDGPENLRYHTVSKYVM